MDLKALRLRTPFPWNAEASHTCDRYEGVHEMDYQFSLGGRCSVKEFATYYSNNSHVLDELDVIQSMFPDEYTEEAEGGRFSITVKSNNENVKLLLKMTISYPDDYPDEPLKDIQLECLEGVFGDSLLESLQDELLFKCREWKGEVVVWKLIEYIGENLEYYGWHDESLGDLSVFPTEIQNEIFQYFDQVDLCRLSMVSRRLNEMSQKNQFWRKFVKCKNKTRDGTLKRQWLTERHLVRPQWRFAVGVVDRRGTGDVLVKDLKGGWTERISRELSRYGMTLDRGRIFYREHVSDLNVKGNVQPKPVQVVGHAKLLSVTQKMKNTCPYVGDVLGYIVFDSQVMLPSLIQVMIMISRGVITRLDGRVEWMYCIHKGERTIGELVNQSNLVRPGLITLPYQTNNKTCKYINEVAEIIKNKLSYKERASRGNYLTLHPGETHCDDVGMILTPHANHLFDVEIQSKSEYGLKVKIWVYAFDEAVPKLLLLGEGASSVLFSVETIEEEWRMNTVSLSSRPDSISSEVCFGTERQFSKRYRQGNGTTYTAILGPRLIEDATGSPKMNVEDVKKGGEDEKNITPNNIGLAQITINSYSYIPPGSPKGQDPQDPGDEMVSLSVIIFIAASKMKGTLSLLIVCIALSQAQVYTSSISAVPPTGYFSQVYTANSTDIVALFRFKADLPRTIQAVTLCDGMEQVILSGYCGTFQIVIYSSVNQTVNFDAPISTTVTKSEFALVSPGQNYTSVDPTIFSARFPLPNYYVTQSGNTGIDFSAIWEVGANYNLTFDVLPYPVYLSSSPISFSLFVDDTTTTVQNFTFRSFPRACASPNQTAVLLRDGLNQTMFINAEGCHRVVGRGQMSITLISDQTPPTLTVSASGNFTATCRTFGNTTDRFALVKFKTNSTGGLVNGDSFSIRTNSSFDQVFNCGGSNTTFLSVQMDGPYQVVDISKDQLSISEAPEGYYQMNVPAGIIPTYAPTGVFFDLPDRCTTATTLYRFSRIPETRFDLCYTVTTNSSFDVPARDSAFVIQPPQGYCIRGDGLPSNSTNDVYLTTGRATFYYEDTNTSLFTLTCSADIVHVSMLERTPMNIKFTLVKIDGQGVYGRNYLINGLSILQYPPLSAVSGVFSLNLTGSVSTLFQFNLDADFSNPSLKGLYPLKVNAFLTNTSSVYRYIVVVQGQGLMTTNLGTAAGINVGYDNNFALNPTTSSTSATKGSGSTTAPLNTGTAPTSPVSAASITRGSIVSVVLVLLALF
ncbi:hypothetical protein PROFUN_08690 [Planoprotostelium fungivorum]|uniref:F-box domain-containing protein n=1 Tax=Planoprotostelium fungivorum TaxID=1890364 RepID=A0A2P6MQW7_9EUKA|nr:hypothetical protein PROFUN_08690 [Planoprotostelium fungivorum]